ncbi:choline oxidase [Seiridium cupressi]
MQPNDNQAMLSSRQKTQEPRTDGDLSVFTITDKTETNLCAGAIDNPCLLLLSVVKDLPGVAENLKDHPEAIITWELNKTLEDETVMWADAAILLCREPPYATGDDGTVPDTMMHIYTNPFDMHAKLAGYDSPEKIFL